MKRIHVLLILLFIFISSAFSTSYGESYGVGNSISSDNNPIRLPLSFSLKNEQYYEFGFTSDRTVSWSPTSPLMTIALEKDEERTAEKLQDDTTGDSNIVASAKFKAYWKIISGYSLRILLLANGKLTGEDGAKTVTVHYSISRDGSAILGYRSDTDSIGDEAEIGNYSPDYTNQVFSTVGSSEFEIVTVSESLDVWSGGVANGELTTVISLRVEVLN